MYKKSHDVELFILTFKAIFYISNVLRSFQNKRLVAQVWSHPEYGPSKVKNVDKNWPKSEKFLTNSNENAEQTSCVSQGDTFTDSFSLTRGTNAFEKIWKIDSSEIFSFWWPTAIEFQLKQAIKRSRQWIKSCIQKQKSVPMNQDKTDEANIRSVVENCYRMSKKNT